MSIIQWLSQRSCKHNTWRISNLRISSTTFNTSTVNGNRRHRVKASHSLILFYVPYKVLWDCTGMLSYPMTVNLLHLAVSVARSPGMHYRSSAQVFGFWNKLPPELTYCDTVSTKSDKCKLKTCNFQSAFYTLH